MNVQQTVPLMYVRDVDASPPKLEFYGMNQVFVRDPDGCALCFENRVDNG